MTQIALVSLDTATGIVRRYTRAPGNVPDLTTEAKFEHWDPLSRDPETWRIVWRDLQIFRIGAAQPPVPDNDPFPPASAQGGGFK